MRHLHKALGEMCALVFRGRADLAGFYQRVVAGLLTLVAGYGYCIMPADADAPKYELGAREVTYEANGITMRGYLAYNKRASERRPGVLVVHEWWGQNEYARKRARMLSMLGYVALAVDMYGGGATASHPDDAAAFAGAVKKDLAGARTRFEAALEFLRQQPQVDPEKVAAVGYCFGGGIVLSMARMGVDLDAVVSFHGSLSTASPAQEGVVKARVLACHGAKDPLVSEDDVAAFHKEMSRAKVDYKFIVYPDAVHAFTNPEADLLGQKFSLPIAYDKWADQSSWESMRQFLEESFR